MRREKKGDEMDVNKVVEASKVEGSTVVKVSVPRNVIEEGDLVEGAAVQRIIHVGTLPYPSAIERSSVGTSVVNVIETARKAASDSVAPTSSPETRERLSQEILAAHPELKHSPEGQAALEQALAALTEFPDAPTFFKDAADYRKYVKRMNGGRQIDRKIINTNLGLLLSEDMERPGKKCVKRKDECADGRNDGGEQHSADLLANGTTLWRPSAGLIIVPEVPNGMTSAQLKEYFKENPGAWAIACARLDHAFREDIEEFVQRRRNPALNVERFLQNFQSHFCAGDDHHGCGAHGSNFAMAQAESIKDSFLLDMWLAQEYSELYKKGAFRIYRTAHDTGEGGSIWAGPHLDKQLAQNPKYKDYYLQHKAMFDEAAERFAPPEPKDTSRPKGFLKGFVKKRGVIELNGHGEPVILFSENPRAFANEQSALENVWYNDEALNARIASKLRDIAYDNFQESGERPDPVIIHLDIPAGSERHGKLITALDQFIRNHPVYGPQVKSGYLQFAYSVTNRHSYECDFFESAAEAAAAAAEIDD